MNSQIPSEATFILSLPVPMRPTFAPARTGPRLLLVQLTKTCFVAPEQWSGIDLYSGDEFYAWARHGKFRAELTNPGGRRIVCDCEGEPGSTGMMLEWCYADIPDQGSAWAALQKERLS